MRAHIFVIYMHCTIHIGALVYQHTHTCSQILLNSVYNNNNNNNSNSSSIMKAV